MSTGFDPYQHWLSIPPAEQPPSHYRLLGLAPFEPNETTIRTSGGQISSYLQQFVEGEHRRDATRLMQEVTAAVNCLCNASSKAAYDQQLRGSYPPSAAPVARPISPAAAAPMASPAPMAKPITSAVAAPVAAPIAAAPSPAAPSPVTPGPSSAPGGGLFVDTGEEKEGTASGGAASRYAKRRQRSNLVMFLSLFAVCVVLVGGALVWMANLPGTTKSTGQGGAASGAAPAGSSFFVFEWNEAERAAAKLHIDGRPRKIPPSGAMRFAARPGAHRITIQRKGFMPIQVRVTTQRNEEKIYEIVWKPLENARPDPTSRFKEFNAKEFPKVGEGAPVPKGEPATEEPAPEKPAPGDSDN